MKTMLKEKSEQLMKSLLTSLFPSQAMRLLVGSFMPASWFRTTSKSTARERRGRGSPKGRTRPRLCRWRIMCFSLQRCCLNIFKFYHYTWDLHYLPQKSINQFMLTGGFGVSASRVVYLLWGHKFLLVSLQRSKLLQCVSHRWQKLALV